jgi:hypothetical protein
MSRRWRVYRQPLLRRTGTGLPPAPGELGSDIRALVINTGVANAGTGEHGWQAAVRPVLRWPATGHRRPAGAALFDRRDPRTLAGRPPARRTPRCVADLRADNWHAAAHAIMTTDTVAKAASRRLEIDGRSVTITGISKGAGMIRPNMATMLGLSPPTPASPRRCCRSCCAKRPTSHSTASASMAIPRPMTPSS